MSNLKCKHCVNLRCPAGQLRGHPCELMDLTDENDMNTIKRGKTATGADSIKFSGPEKHPKSGPRAMTKGDNQKFESGYDRIWGNKPPICGLCKGQAEAGTCPNCN